MKSVWLLVLTLSAGSVWANHHSEHEHEKSADHAHHDEHGHDDHGHDDHGHDEHGHDDHGHDDHGHDEHGHDEHGHDEHGHDDHGHDDHDSHNHSGGIHQHGVSRLEAAFNGSVFQAQLTAPMVDWVGFEQIPNNDEQRATLSDVKALLQQGGIALMGGDCQLESVTFQGFDVDKMKDSDHLDLSALSKWNCQSPQEVTGLSVTAFEHFPGMLSVEAAVITANDQIAGQLNADQPTLEMAN